MLQHRSNTVKSNYYIFYSFFRLSETWSILNAVEIIWLLEHKNSSVKWRGKSRWPCLPMFLSCRTFPCETVSPWSCSESTAKKIWIKKKRSISNVVYRHLRNMLCLTHFLTYGLFTYSPCGFISFHMWCHIINLFWCVKCFMQLHIPICLQLIAWWNAPSHVFHNWSHNTHIRIWEI